MAPWLRLAALPSSLLLFIANSAVPVAAQHSRWPYNLPPEVKYYPEDEFLLKRDIDVQQKLQEQPVTGVRKMSHDPGEKFYLDYWGFNEEDEEMSYLTYTNATIWATLHRPMRVHSQPGNQSFFARLPGWNLLSKRDFQCPSGTSACTSINRPNSCCASGSTCEIVEDTGLGDVGCCPSGQTCAGTLSSCEEGYTSCPNDPGGGCCIPGYACYDVGCVQTSYATLTPSSVPTPSTTTVTSYTTITPSASTHSTSTSRTSISTTSQSTSLEPQISTVTRTVTVTSTPNVLTCSSGYRSCPATLGGGCCPTDRSCGSANCPASTSSPTPAPPVRPTTLTTTEVTTTVTPNSKSTASLTTTTSSSSATVTGCPTGFYACSAYYQGGCCQIGRNCDTTSCPASASTTLVSGSTLTIAAPTGSGITAPGTVLTGSCAQGWMTCSADLGGGCCPSGYQCGITSCAALATGGAGVGKMPPNGAGKCNINMGMALAITIMSFGALWL
ncbi:uncharacterized protein PV06_10878 [Exophiala oligosperma]|uniref:GPI anchored protein n=1 Tax=Exophiala oligosperma TaxID=215243 RepID=A0A0D2D3V8_9EURO|nr:uncharacterized protein PV06_10878 [Exophiala oligosperma]KIW36980.1 hypothetical protein PV06_10878 [Exophiala oligosperma]